MSKPDPFLDACGSSLIFISLISLEVKSKFFLAVCLCVFFIVTYYMINSAAKIIESLEETNKILKKRQYEEVTLLRENKEINIFNYLLKGITWLSVRDGENIFVCESEEGIRNMSTKITHQNLYEGV